MPVGSSSVSGIAWVQPSSYPHQSNAVLGDIEVGNELERQVKYGIT